MCIACNKNKIEYNEYHMLKEINCVSCDKIIHIEPPNNIKTLKCGYTNIKQLPYMPNLEFLSCYYTNIEKIPLFTKLRILYCWNTKIKIIKDMPALEELYIDNTKISQIPNCKKLKIISCSDTNVTVIPYFEDLIFIDCSNTCVTSLPNIKRGCIISKGCRWLHPEKDDLKKLLVLQRFARKIIKKKLNIVCKTLNFDRYFCFALQ
jgi:Leucine-rich repeat (LRR) protein